MFSLRGSQILLEHDETHHASCRFPTNHLLNISTLWTKGEKRPRGSAELPSLPRVEGPRH